jgi:hypothetical protein
LYGAVGMIGWAPIAKFPYNLLAWQKFMPA